MRKSIASGPATLALAALLLACRSDRPEDQIRRAFDGCVAAVEAGDAAAAVEPLDAAFRGPEGLDRAGARLYLMNLFRQEKVGLTVLRTDLQIQGPLAVQEVDLVLTGRTGGILPQDASRRSFGLTWRRTPEGWRIQRIEER